MGWGGQEVRVLTEARWLEERGWKLLIACQPGSGIARHAGAYGVSTVSLRMRASCDASALMALIMLIRQEAVRLVHTHSSIDSWLGGIAARLTRRPVIRSRHVSVPVRRGWNPVYALLADRILTSGQTVRRLLIRAGVRPEKIVSLPAGVDFDRFHPGVSPDRVREEFQLAWPVLGSVAMFRGSKGHLDLLDAFALAGAGTMADVVPLIGENRAQVRLRKRLTSPQGAQDGSFTATLMFAFQPERTRSIDDVWQNPFGFTVTQYAIRSDRSE